MASLAELLRKPVEIVEVLPGPPAPLHIEEGDAVVFNCSHLPSANEPLPGAPMPLALSQEPAAVGPVLQPHQLFSAFTLPSEFTNNNPLVEEEAVLVLLKKRL